MSSDDNIVIATLHSTDNDKNGNPRRVWVFREVHVYATDGEVYPWADGYTNIAFTHDEGYGSLRNAIENFRSTGATNLVVNNGGVECSVRDYRRLVGLIT